MNGMGGLFEIVIVLAIALGWGFIEWRSNRRYKAQVEKERLSSRGGGAEPGSHDTVDS